MRRCGWTVTGLVQKVHFRKLTKLKAEQLGISGWCRNSPDGSSVVGELEGSRRAVDEMLQWLRSVGSPKSRIDHLTISNMPR